MQALNVSTAIQALSYFLPIFAVVLLDSPRELLIFISGPVSLVGSILVLCGACLVDARVLLLPLSDQCLCSDEEFFMARAGAQEAMHEGSAVLVLRGQAQLTILRHVIGPISHDLILVTTKSTSFIIQLGSVVTIIRVCTLVVILVVRDSYRVGRPSQWYWGDLMVLHSWLRVRLIVVELTGCILQHALILLVVTALLVLEMARLPVDTKNLRS